MDDELTLRDLAEILRRKRFWVLGTLAFTTVLGGLYAFVLAKPKYESYAILGINPLEIKAQLENKIELRPANILTPETLNALLVSHEVLIKTAKGIQNNVNLPENWRGLSLEELAAILRSLMKIKVVTKKVEKGAVLTAKLQTTASSPALAAAIANQWAKISVQTLDKLTTGQLLANLDAITEQLTGAEKAFRKAQEDWEAFQRESQLEDHKQELSYRIGKHIELTKELEFLEQTIRTNEKRLQAIQSQIAREARRYKGKPNEVDLIFIGKSLNEALEMLKIRLAEAKQTYESQRMELDNLKRQIPFETWKQELAKYQARIATIQLRLKELETQRALLLTKLNTTKTQLANTPMRIELKREVIEEPITLALKEQPSDLAGLVLSNETLNPLYSSLEKQVSNLKTQLAALDRERKALLEEKAAIEQRENALRNKYVEATSKLDALTLQVKSAENHYEKLNQLYESYRGLKKNALIEPNQPLYQRLRGQELTLKIELTSLRAKKMELARQLRQNQDRISALKGLVAKDELTADRLQENLRLTKETYLALKQKQTDLKIELASLKGTFAQVLAPAYPDPEPVAPKKTLILALSAILGLMFGVFAAFISAALEAPPESLTATPEA